MNRLAKYYKLLNYLWNTHGTEVITKTEIFDRYHDFFNEPVDIERFLLFIEFDPLKEYTVKRTQYAIQLKRNYPTPPPNPQAN